jgi:hypothetical protein
MAGALALAGGVAVALLLRDAALCRAERDLWAVTLAEVQAFEAEDLLRDPAPALPCPEPALACWHAAVGALTAFKAARNSSIDWSDPESVALLRLEEWTSGPPPPIPEAWRRGLDPVIDALDRATRTERLGPPWKTVDYATMGDGPEADLPNFLHAGTRSCLFPEVRLRAFEGQTAAALELAFLMDRAAIDVLWVGSSMSKFLGQNLRLKVRELLADLLANGLLEEDALDAALRETSLPPVPVDHSIRGVFLETQQVYFPPGSGLWVVGWPDFAGAGGLLDRTIDTVAEWFRGEDETIGRAKRVRLWRWFREVAQQRPGEGGAAYVARLAAVEAACGDERRKELLRSCIAVPRQVEEGDALIRSAHAALRIGIAFRRYRVREGAAPATIGEILPPGVPATPLTGTFAIEPDPGSGEPCFSFRAGKLTILIR